MEKNIDQKLLTSLYRNLPPQDEKVTLDWDKRIPTVSPSVNWALEGGLVPGRFYCFWGPESSGKTMFAAACCAEMLRRNPIGRVVWFDTEESWDGHWEEIYMPDQAGLDYDDPNRRFIVQRVSFGRDIFDYYIDVLAKAHDSGIPILACVVDSKEGIVAPAEEARESTEDNTMAALARYLPVAFRKLTPQARKRNTTWIFISQVGQQFDDMKKRMGDIWTIAGGQKFLHWIDALMLFEQSVGKINKVLDDSRTGMDDNPIQVGNYIKMKVKGKCRVGVPNRVAKFKFLYHAGVVSPWEEIAELATRLGVVVKQGRTFFYGDAKLAASDAEYKQKVKDDLELQNNLYKGIMECKNELFSGGRPAPEVEQSGSSEEAV